MVFAGCVLVLAVAGWNVCAAIAGNRKEYSAGLLKTVVALGQQYISALSLLIHAKVSISKPSSHAVSLTIKHCKAKVLTTGKFVEGSGPSGITPWTVVWPGVKDRLGTLNLPSIFPIVPVVLDNKFDCFLPGGRRKGWWARRGRIGSWWVWSWWVWCGWVWCGCCRIIATRTGVWRECTNSVLNPIVHCTHAGVDARDTLSGTAASKGNDAHLDLSSGNNQRSTV